MTVGICAHAATRGKARSGTDAGWEGSSFTLSFRFRPLSSSEGEMLTATWCKDILNNCMVNYVATTWGRCSCGCDSQVSKNSSQMENYMIKIHFCIFEFCILILVSHWPRFFHNPVMYVFNLNNTATGSQVSSKRKSLLEKYCWQAIVTKKLLG